ncbi:MAG: C25 family peptidase propeptide domain-containing protein, partial [Thermodesulfobacteriota bacterium]
YQKITMPDFGKTTDAGNPELPLRGVLIGVPDAGVPDIEALDSDYTLLQGYNIYPAPRPVVVEEEGDKRLDFEFVMDKAVYSADAFFPFEVTKVGFTGFMRDQKAVKVIFSPVQFNPVTGEVKFYSRIRVRVNFNTPPVGRGLAPAMKKSKGRRSAGGVSGAYEGMLKGLLLNYDEMRR